jgi:hypothetical protein
VAVATSPNAFHCDRIFHSELRRELMVEKSKGSDSGQLYLNLSDARQKKQWAFPCDFGCGGDTRPKVTHEMNRKQVARSDGPSFLQKKGQEERVLCENESASYCFQTVCYYELKIV